MASLYFDSDIQPDFAGLLSADGNDVITARDLRNLTATDGEHSAVATTRGSLLITHNGNDVKTLCRAWHVWRKRWHLEELPHAGVIAIPQQTRLP